MTIRRYNPEKDHDSVLRIWLECGWLEKDDVKPLDYFLEGSTAWVGEFNGEAETLVTNMKGTIRHGQTDLPMCGIASVTTSRVARKQGQAGQVTARAIAHDAMEGALVATLGTFEQGYYNRLGFGTLSYDLMFNFDPSTLRIRDGLKARPPKRLTKDDYEIIHANRLQRCRGHGSCSLTPAKYSQAEMEFTAGGFGLGYFDGPGKSLSHHFWCTTRGKDEHGPYTLQWMAYETNEQFLELMALLKGLGDQVRLVRMINPPNLMLQDLLDQPFHRRAITDKSEFSQSTWYAAWQQARM
ncbi:MAG: GNAT family N-acetyltransferase, partial [Planctomycetota bacterium]|nr:GNAT family N-acetyltransferase [Planctomycetota bacterium]